MITEEDEEEEVWGRGCVWSGLGLGDWGKARWCAWVELGVGVGTTHEERKVLIISGLSEALEEVLLTVGLKWVSF